MIMKIKSKMNAHSKSVAFTTTKWAQLAIIAGLLTSCVGAVVVGAAGSMIVYDRRSLTMIEKDARIFYVISRAIAKHGGYRHSHLSITSNNQVVLLAGEVTSDALRADAQQIAQTTPNVRRVYNELTISEPISIRQRSEDTIITGQVRANMLAQKGLESGSIRIITENGVVHLMGIATHEQANLAVNVARQVPGVRKVVKIFQYISL